MPAIKYKINLSDNERQILQAVVQKGKSAARSQTRARILLKAAEGSRDKDIIDALNVSPSMVAKTRQRCVEEGPESALKDHPRPGKAPNSPINKQLISLRWPAVMRPMAITTGHCACWRAK